MNATSFSQKPDLKSCIAHRDQVTDIWSIHVDEIAEWRPQNESFEEWMRQLCEIYKSARVYAGPSDVIAVTLSFEPSLELETFNRLEELLIDFYTPPSLYILNKPLTFASAGEQYFRVLKPSAVPFHIPGSVVIARSARSTQGLECGWEFDNTIYITSRFES